MDPMLVLSPHMDDAVLSVGQVLAGRPGCIVATLFTKTPDRGRQLTTYDKNCGFRSARDAMVRRRREDRSALHMLGARGAHLNLLDHQYRGDVNPDEESAIEGLCDLVDREGISQVVGPLGLAHPDHVVTARIYLGVLTLRPGLEAWLYEDLPSRVLYPDMVGPALDAWRGWGFDPVIGFLGTGPLAAKEQAIAAYSSQTWALDPHAVLCPERLYRLGRTR